MLFTQIQYAHASDDMQNTILIIMVTPLTYIILCILVGAQQSARVNIFWPPVLTEEK